MGDAWLRAGVGSAVLVASLLAADYRKHLITLYKKTFASKLTALPGLV